jgi:AcrR family transcriptional regulator
VPTSRGKPSARAEAQVNSDDPPRVDAVPQRHLGYKQHRSLQTFERLLDAAEELLSQRLFSEVSINDICVRAGVSVGGFYRRFESRDGLLHVLHERYTERAIHLQSVALSPARWDGVPMEQMLARVIEETIQVTRKNSGLLLATAHLASSDRTVGAREGRIHSEFHACMTRLILLRVESIGHPRPRTAAAFCSLQLRAALFYRYQLSLSLQMPAEELTDREFATELARAAAAYLSGASESFGSVVQASATRWRHCRCHFGRRQECQHRLFCSHPPSSQTRHTVEMPTT